MKIKFSGADWMYSEIDPELFPQFDYFNKTAGNISSLPVNERREIQAGFNPTEPEWVSEILDVKNTSVPGYNDDPDIPVRVYTPLKSDTQSPRPCLLCIHGGGMWTGSLDSEHATFARFARDLNAVVVSVDYRLAPENPYPAGLHDCFAALQWCYKHAQNLGIDSQQISIYGGSAGGGLAIGLALFSRDNNGPHIQNLMALYPMIDDTNSTPSSYQIDGTGAGAWDRSDNIEGWRWYLADAKPDIYSSPARASIDELEGLPPMYIDIGTLDLFRDESLAFVSKLCTAGNNVEFHLIPHMFHGGENVKPDADISRRMWDCRINYLQRVMSVKEVN